MEEPISISLLGEIRLSMIKVEGGTFYFGKTENQVSHKVSVTDFCIGQYPITNCQYAAFLQAYGSDQVLNGEFAGETMVYSQPGGILEREGRWLSTGGYEQHPAIFITWQGANAFCQWLSQKTGNIYCLPSEAQWEYAARGGRYSQGLAYAGSYKLKEVGWYKLNSHNETREVGLKQPNELGIYDMSGNVWEWCLDHAKRGQKQIPLDGSPWLNLNEISDRKASRVVRGGSFDDLDNGCRVSDRKWYSASDLGIISVGFRIAKL